MQKENNIFFGISSQEIDKILGIGVHSNSSSKESLKNLQTKGGIAYLENSLKTSIKTGISNDKNEILERIKCFGTNKMISHEEKGFCYFVCEVLSDTFLRVLIFCAILQISIGASPLSENPKKDWIDGLGIVFAIFVVVLTSSVTNYQKEKEFRNLSKMNDDECNVTVLRNNNQINLNFSELLVGDIIKLTLGMNIPADGIVIEGNDLKIDESSLTGESKMIKKNTLENCIKFNEENHLRFKDNLIADSQNNTRLSNPFLYSSTCVNSGYGSMLVLAVGKESIKGKLQDMILSKGEPEESITPLEFKLQELASDIGKFGIFASIFTLIALLSSFFFSKFEEYTYHNKLYQEMLKNSSKINDTIDNNLYNNTLNSYNQTNVTRLSQNNFTFLLNNADQIINPTSIYEGAYKEIIKAIILCITIIVVAIPEGLPLAVTLALSFSLRKMMQVNNLVRKISSCEVVGGANYICTDKTGTLTHNKLELVGFVLNENIYEKRNNNAHKNISLIESQIGEKNFTFLLNSILLNLNIVINNNFEIAYGLELDKSLFKFFDEVYRDETRKIITNSSNIIYDRIPFDSIKKKMSTIIKLDPQHDIFKENKRIIDLNDNLYYMSNDNKNMLKKSLNEISPQQKYIIYTKGAAENIVELCTKIKNYKNDSIENITEINKKMISLNIEKFAGLSYRLIGIAYKDLSIQEVREYHQQKLNNDDNNNYSLETSGFTFLGFLCFKDTIRVGVIEAVKTCQNAGINIIMITGDNPISAVAIAEECNIINSFQDNLSLDYGYSQNDKNKFINGTDFYTRIGGLICESCSLKIEICKCPPSIEAANKYSISEDKLRKEKIGSIESFRSIITQYKVFSRARPIDKYCLVKGLKELGNVVAVTGDGTNDAPALRKSDVGFSMGISGTDVAKNASDIILLDDNFASIVNAVLWGRGIYDNIRKFIQFQLTVNISAVLLVFCSSCVGSESPISAIQMLWLNMIMDSLGSLSLATESPRSELLKNKPHSRREYIINPMMWKHIIFQAFIQFFAVFLLYLYAPQFIVENNHERIYINEQLKNCFGKFPGEKVSFKKHNIIHYILDGKKSQWDPLKLIKRNLDANFCFFYDLEKFEKGTIKNLKHAYTWIISEFGNTVHMTIIFNTFVLYALFNQLNSRILDDSLNIFRNIQHNLLFVLIISLEIAIQIGIVQYGEVMFNCVKGGLTLDQWLICVSIASISLLVSAFLKCCRIEKIFQINLFKKIKCIFCCASKNEENERLIEMIDQ